MAKKRSDKPTSRKEPLKFPGGKAPPKLTEQEQENLDANKAWQNRLATKDARRIAKLQEQLGETTAIREEIANACERIEMPPTYYRPSRKKTTLPVVRPVLLLSDWHIGDVVREEETEGFGKFDISIAQARVGNLVTRFLRYIDGLRAMYTIDDIDVMVVGDMISGDIHDELTTNNEVTAPEQAVISGKMLTRTLMDIGTKCNTVKVHFCGADNHSRLSRKPVAKKKAMSWSHVVGNIMIESLPKNTAGDGPAGKYQVNMFKGMEEVVEILNTKFLVTHGDGIKSWMGLPWYGVQRRIGNEALKRQHTNKTFNIFVMGHYHTPVSTPYLIVNGSLSGTTEYDHGCGRHCGPCQVSFLVSPTHGVFNQISWWL